MHPVPPGLDGPTLEQEQPDGSAALPYQLGANATGQPAAIMRYAISPAERAAIARGDDLFVVMYLDDRPLPSTSLHVGSPLVGEGVEPGPLDHVVKTDNGLLIPTREPGTTPADHVDAEGGALDGRVFTPVEALQQIVEGACRDYILVEVEDMNREPSVKHFRFMHDDIARRHGIECDDDDDEGDEGDDWKRGK